MSERVLVVGYKDGRDVTFDRALVDVDDIEEGHPWPEGMPSPVELADAVVAFEVSRSVANRDRLDDLARQIVRARERAGRGE